MQKQTLQMISKAQIKKIASYKEAKFRNQDKVFIVEGVKMVDELINSAFEIEFICALPQWIEANKAIYKRAKNILELREEDLKKLSTMKSPNQVLAVVKQQTPKEIILEDRLVIVLDQIKDPGNLGTIIRLSHWFGIEDIICSENSVDIYNPKTIQSTMGSFFRVNITYTNLKKYLKSLPKTYPVYCSVLEGGKNIYNETLSSQGLIVIGSESHGISKEVLSEATHLIKIPNFAKGSKAESLNASIAAGIIISEFKRR